LVLVGKTREVFNNKDFLSQIGLDVPQITELFYRLNKKNPSIRKDILTVEEAVNELRRIMIN
jgi:hypothetical protein